MSQKYRRGQHVTWNYAGHIASGQIKEVFKEQVCCKIKGKETTRHGSEAEPANLIVQEDGDQVLMSERKLSKID